MALLFGGDPSRSAAVRAERTRELARQFVEKGVAGVIFQPMEFFEQSARYNQEVVAIFTAARIRTGAPPIADRAGRTVGRGR